MIKMLNREPLVQSWRQHTWDCSTAKSRGLAQHNIDVGEAKMDIQLRAIQQNSWRSQSFCG